MRAVVCIVLAVALTSCKSDKKSPTDTAPTKTQEAAPPVRPMLPKGAKRQSARPLVPIANDEVKALLTAPENAQVLGETGLGPTRRQLRTAWCLTVADSPAATALLRAHLNKIGWSRINAHPHQRTPSRVGMSAQKQQFRLTATIQPTDNPLCTGANKRMVSVLIHKLDRASTVKPPPSKAAGAVAPNNAQHAVSQ